MSKYKVGDVATYKLGDTRRRMEPFSPAIHNKYTAIDGWLVRIAQVLISRSDSGSSIYVIESADRHPFPPSPTDRADYTVSDSNLFSPEVLM